MFATFTAEAYYPYFHFVTSIRKFFLKTFLPINILYFIFVLSAKLSDALIFLFFIFTSVFITGLKLSPMLDFTFIFLSTGPSINFLARRLSIELVLAPVSIRALCFLPPITTVSTQPIIVFFTAIMRKFVF